MKNITLPLVVFTVFMSINLRADDESMHQRHELGLNMFNVFNPKEVVRGGSYLYAKTNMNYINGLTYKYKFKKIALNFGADYYSYKYDLEDVDLKRSGKQQFVEVRIGIERVFWNYTYNRKMKLKPYVRFDIYSAIGNDKGNNNQELFNNKIREMGLGPAMGLRLNLTQNIVFSVEASAALSIIDLHKMGEYALIKQTWLYYYAPRFFGISYSF